MLVFFTQFAISTLFEALTLHRIDDFRQRSHLETPNFPIFIVTAGRYVPHSIDFAIMTKSINLIYIIKSFGVDSVNLDGCIDFTDSMNLFGFLILLITLINFITLVILISWVRNEKQKKIFSYLTIFHTEIILIFLKIFFVFSFLGHTVPVLLI